MYKQCTFIIIQDLANFTPFPDEWTVEDKVLFEQVISKHYKLPVVLRGVPLKLLSPLL